MFRHSSALLPTIIISSFLVIIAGVGIGIYLHNQSVQHKAQQAAAAQVQQEQQVQAQAESTAKQNLNKCINNANQQEITQLQDEKNTIAEDNATGTYYDPSVVNSYIQELQQDTQTEITECQAQFPQ